MKRHTIVVLIIVSLLFLLLGGITFYLFGKKFHPPFLTQPATDKRSASLSKKDPIVTCKAGDKECAAKNEKTKVKNLDGAAAKFVSHQCDGPRDCPTPTEEEATAIKSAIRAYAKDTKLELLLINGITPTGLVYYCAEDERCWSYDTKSKKVTLL